MILWVISLLLFGRQKWNSEAFGEHRFDLPNNKSGFLWAVFCRFDYHVPHFYTILSFLRDLWVLIWISLQFALALVCFFWSRPPAFAIFSLSLDLFAPSSFSLIDCFEIFCNFLFAQTNSFLVISFTVNQLFHNSSALILFMLLILSEGACTTLGWKVRRRSTQLVSLEENVLLAILSFNIVINALWSDTT